jgi:hypothetical protein
MTRPLRQAISISYQLQQFIRTSGSVAYFSRRHFQVFYVDGIIDKFRAFGSIMMKFMMLNGWMRLGWPCTQITLATMYKGKDHNTGFDGLQLV